MKRKLQFDRDKLMGVLKTAKSKEETSGFQQDQRFWKPNKPEPKKTHTYRIRPIPIITKAGYPEPEVKIIKHMYKSDITGQFVNVVCPKTKGNSEKCPICDYSWELWNSGDPLDKKEFQNYKNKTQYVTNILVVKDVGEDRQDNVGKVFMYMYGKKVHDKFQDVMFPDEESGEEPILFYDPVEGIDFFLKVSKVDEYPNYDSSKFAQSASEIADDEDSMMNILESAYDIAEELLPDSEFKNYAELKEILEKTITGHVTKSEVEDEVESKSDPVEEEFADIIGSTDDEGQDEDDFVAELEAELER